MLRTAEDKNLRTYGIDISSNAVEKAKRNAKKSEIIVGSGEKLPWPDEYFDYITCLGSLEHYINPESGVKEICRVLKKDGLSAIMLPNKYLLYEVMKALFKGDSSEQWQILERSASKEEWWRFLEKSGLKVKKIFKYNKYPELFQTGTWKLKSIRKFIVVSCIRYLAPFNFASSFVYLCKK
jgi:ubiquinone/menaquinone biosynthesis C-methylase UbiE